MLACLSEQTEGFIFSLSSTSFVFAELSPMICIQGRRAKREKTIRLVYINHGRQLGENKACRGQAISYYAF